MEHGNFLAIPIPASTFHGTGAGHHAIIAKCSMIPSRSADTKYVPRNGEKDFIFLLGNQSSWRGAGLHSNRGQLFIVAFSKRLFSRDGNQGADSTVFSRENFNALNEMVIQLFCGDCSRLTAVMLIVPFNDIESDRVISAADGG